MAECLPLFSSVAGVNEWLLGIDINTSIAAMLAFMRWLMPCHGFADFSQKIKMTP